MFNQFYDFFFNYTLLKKKLPNLTNFFFIFFSKCLKQYEIGLRATKRMCSLFSCVEEICMKNPTGPRTIIINNSINNTMRLAILGIYCICISIVAFIVHPSYTFLIEGKRELIMNILMPFVDPKTLLGFLILTFIHYIYSLLSISGSTTMMFYSHVAIQNYLLLIDLFENSLDTMGSLHRRKNCTEIYKRAFFRNIAVAFQDIDK